MMRSDATVMKPRRWHGARRAMIALLGVLLLALCGGCATLISGSTERIRFESDPPGAQIRVDGRTYTTPVEVTLPRDRNHEVEFVLPGHAPARRQVTRDVNGWTYGNILLGGVIGMAIDTSTGASNDLEPDVVSVQLMRVEPETEGAAEAADTTSASAGAGPDPDEGSPPANTANAAANSAPPPAAESPPAATGASP